MIYIEYTYVDVNTRLPVTVEPALNGPDAPGLAGLLFGFALESEYPTATPTLFGTASDEADTTTPGVLAVLTREEYDAALATELAARAAILRRTRLSEIPAERFKREIAGLIWNGIFIDTDETSQAKLTSTRASAKEGLRVDGSIWKCGDPQTGEILYRPTTNAEMIEIGDLVFTYVQSCYDREGILMNMVKADTYTDDMLNTGWPARV